MIISSKQELDILREGGKRLAQHLQELSKLVVVGATAHAVEQEALARIKQDGDEPAFLAYKSGRGEKPYPSALCISVNDVIVHSPASDNGAVFAEGDVVSLDFGVRHRGLFTDHAVTFILGTPRNAEDERLVRVAYEALDAGIAQALVGNTTGDIGYAVETIARRERFGFPRNLSGHGVGKKVHEEPHVPNFGAPGTGEKLVEGLVIAIEPMFTLGSGELYIDKDTFSYRTKDKSRSAHVEHTVVLTKNGPEILTKV